MKWQLQIIKVSDVVFNGKKKNVKKSDEQLKTHKSVM